MNVCSAKHDEVYYEVKRCPVCLMRDERDEVRILYELGEDARRDLADEIANLMNQLEEKSNA